MMSHAGSRAWLRPLAMNGSECLAGALQESSLAILNAPSAERNWYALYTLPNHEKSAASFLALNNIETYLPLYNVVHRWKNRCTRKIDLPLFPRYLFARFCFSQRFHLLGFKSVVSIVSGGQEPAVLSDEEIAKLRDGLRARKAEPHPYLTVGERARIRRGALSGLEGIVIRKKNELRVVITLDLIVRSVAVEVDGADLESIGSPLPPHSFGSNHSAGR